MNDFIILLSQSTGIGVGTLLGVLIGMGMRVRAGNRQGLIFGSLMLTAFTAAMGAMLFVTLLKYLFG